MAQEELKKYLEGIRKRLTALLEKDFNEEKEFIDLRSKLQMVIRRVYPNYEKVEKKWIEDFIIWNDDGNSSQFRKESFLRDVNDLIIAVNTILEEDEIFGLKDFTPIKEKEEKEYQIGSERFGGFFRKKKTK